jgi:hypothetical protein
MSRADFTMDALFGMPGVEGPGSLKLIDEGLPTEHFENTASEQTYQLWLRGYNSKALAVRDELKGLQGDLTVNDLGKWWQDCGFIPKRPGD